METLKKVSVLLKGNKAIYFGAIIASLVASILGMVNPIIIQITTDTVLYKKPVENNDFIASLVSKVGGPLFLEKNLWIMGGLLILATALTGVFNFIRARLISISSTSMSKNLRDSMYDHIQKLPYDYHVKSKAGDLIQRCTSDINTARQFFSVQVVEIIRTFVIVIFALCIMVTYSVKLTLISMCFLPFLVIAGFVFFNKSRKFFLKVDEKEGELATVLEENLSGVRVVRAFGRQQYEVELFDKRNKEFKDLSIKMNHLHAIYWPATDILSYIQVIAVLLSSIYFAYKGEISVGTVILFNSYVGMLLWPIRNSGRILSDMGKMQVSISRIYEILETKEEEEEPNSLTPSLKGDIVFNNVSFSYDTTGEDEKDNEKIIIKNLSFTIKNGETIAILGTTGSGKSTIMHLLLRLYDYQSGSIKINGVELRQINKHHLRKNIGIVLQEPFLYSKTIKENIIMANEHSDFDDVVEMSKIAAVHDNIMEFEKEYETLVGERGVTLSGGQKQRVAIARTLIKNSSIVIFDDSLSAVDTETDLQIRNALKSSENKSTKIIISQRITTLMNADNIFIIEDGILTETGNHQELIKTGGLYSRIWNIQTMMESEFDNDSEVTEVGGI